MNVHIIGPSGSGKTYLGKLIASTFKLRHIALDELFWENNGTYNQERPSSLRDHLFYQEIKDPGWVVEGVYYDWVEQSFNQADIIILLKVAYPELEKRIWGRYFKRKKLGSNRKETVETVEALLTWLRDVYIPINLPTIETRLKAYSHKTIVSNNADLAFLELRIKLMNEGLVN